MWGTMTNRTVSTGRRMLSAAVAAGVLAAATPGWASDVADAVMRGDGARLEQLLQQGADVNEPQADGATALHWAAYRNDLDAVRRLLAAGADVNVANRTGTTPLLMASIAGNAEMIRLMLEAGADPNETFTNGETALMMAARTGRADAIEVLIEHGAEIDAREKLRGTTALMWAAAYSNPDAVRVLLDAGADYSATSAVIERGRRPYLAPPARERIEEYITGTGSRGAALTFRLDGDQPGGDDAAAAEAGDADPADATEAGDDSNAAAVSAAAGDADAADGDVDALLVEAANALAESSAALRAEAGAADSAASDDGAGSGSAGDASTALADRLDALAARVAALADTVTVLAERLDAFAAAPAGTPAAPAAPTETPAAPEDEAAIAAADVAPEDEVDEEAFFGGGGQVDWGGLTPLIFAAREGDIESVKLLLEAGADVNQTSEFGWTALLTATQNRYYQLGKYLLEQGADPNLANKNGWNPLYIATDNRNIEGGDYPTREPDMDHLAYIELLLEHGADPNQRLATDCGRPGCASTETRTIFTHQWLYEEGATPFLRAAQSGDLELLKLLLEHGADPSIPTRDYVTPLMVASGIGWVEGVTFEWSPEQTFEVVKMLLELGADPNARETLDGRTALMGAAHKGRTEVVQLLVDHGADLAARDIGSRDSIHALAGVTWQAIDYADGLVRVGVQSAIPHPETAALLRRLMQERGLETPPEGRTLDSICITDVCKPGYQP